MLISITFYMLFYEPFQVCHLHEHLQALCFQAILSETEKGLCICTCNFIAYFIFTIDTVIICIALLMSLDAVAVPLIMKSSL